MFKPRFVLRSFNGEENRPLSGAIMQTLLGTLTSINIEIMRRKRLPPLYSSGVRYVRDGESFGRDDGPEDWQDAEELLARGVGDCKSLACYRAAELQVLYGIKAFAQFRWRDKEVGSLYHIVVQHPDGRIEDPSAKLGMFDRRHY